MNNQILIKIKSKIAELAIYGELDAETKRNFLKEDLQYYVLNFIYHHPKYSDWTMYEGSALRICYNLNRMSVDLDFEIIESCTQKFLNNLKTEILDHFLNTYNVGTDFLNIKLVNGRGLRLNFNIGDELDIRHTSKQVHIKIDLNQFTAPKAVIERIPINNGQLSFVIKTYNMSALMASKIAAIFLRGTRGIGKAVYEEKGRDIYDLLWYMEKKAIPDLNYLKAKEIDIKDLRVLFNKLTLKINAVSSVNLEQDLKPLFLDQNFITNWLKNWLGTYFYLLGNYKIHTVTGITKIIITEDFSTDNFSFIYTYNTQETDIVKIVYTVTYEWIKSQKSLGIDIREDIIPLVSFKSDAELNDQLKQFATLFFGKNTDYIKKVNRIMLGDAIITKVIRTPTTTDNFNQKEQVFLNRSALLSCELEDLLK